MNKIKISKKVAVLLETLPVESYCAVEECQNRLSAERLLPDEEPFTKERSVLLLPTWDLIIIRRQRQQWAWYTKNHIEIENLIPAAEIRAFILAKVVQTDEVKTDPLQTAVETLVKGAERGDRYKKLIQTGIGIILAGASLFGSQVGLAEKFLKGLPSSSQPNPAQVQIETPPK
jgi:hypothetical protein